MVKQALYHFIRRRHAQTVAYCLRTLHPTHTQTDHATCDICTNTSCRLYGPKFLCSPSIPKNHSNWL